jgi:hypothetical protein
MRRLWRLLDNTQDPDPKQGELDMGYNTGRVGADAAIPAGEDFVMREIRDLQRFVREMSAQVNALRPGSLVTSLLADSAVTAPKVGPAAITAPAIADGAVTAPALGPGSVGYAALAAPTLPAAANMTATAFAPTATWAEIVGLDLVVPTDCTRLLMTATCWCYSINNSAAADDLHTRVSLGATDGQALLTPLAVAAYGTISAGLAVLADSLTPGATIRLKASAKTTTGTWTTDSANVALLTASLTWLH